MNLEDMNIPAKIKQEAADIVLRIEHATGMLDATMAGGVAEGFLIGLACAGAIAPRDVEDLETLFGNATDQKMGWLRKNS